MSEDTEGPGGNPPEVEEKEIVAPSREDFDPSLLGRLWETKTKSNTGAMAGGELIARRKATFTMDGAVCAKDYFVDSEGRYLEFKVTMRALSSTEELEALDGIKNEAEAPMRLAKRCLYAMNGVALSGDQRDHMWEAFAMGGRQMCLMVFLNYLGSAGAAALGKLLSSCSID